MGERKIRIRQLPDGTWAAGVDGWLDVVVATAQSCGSTATALAHGAPLTAPVCVDSTPWKASAAVYEALGEDITIEWETLPWEAKRLAYGITEGVTGILGASREARRAIDAANYEEEMRELGVSEYVTLTAEKRAMLAARAARFFHAGRVPDRSEAERELKWTKVASGCLPGYGRAAGLMSAALANGYPERRRGRRLMRRAWSALVAANARNDIAPDSR
jgi:hypothetical protein